MSQMKKVSLFTEIKSFSEILAKFCLKPLELIRLYGITGYIQDWNVHCVGVGPGCCRSLG